MKKKILFVNGHLDIGGIEKTLIDLLRRIDYSIYDVDLLLLQGSGDYCQLVPEEVSVICYNNRESEGPFFKSLIHCIRIKRFDLILFRILEKICRVFKSTECISLLKPYLSLRKYDFAIAYRQGSFCDDVVVYAVDAPKKYMWWHNPEVEFSECEVSHNSQKWDRFTNIVTVSEGCKRALSVVFPELESKMVVMYNVLDIDSIYCLSEVVPDEYQFDNCVKMVSVGNLIPRKHFENIVYVCDRLVSEGIKNFKWFIVGDGPERDSIENSIKARNLQNMIFMLGKRINPYPYLRYADFFVHPSYGEAHCTSILEAMALKKPCVVTETIIRQDFTKDGINCIEVKRDPQSLYEGVKMIIQDNRLASSISENAYLLVKSTYSPNIILNNFYSILNK